MLAGIQGRDDELERHRDNLELLVAERTAELQQRNEAMRLVLDNVEQGLAIIHPSGSLSGERSRAFDAWFGRALAKPMNSLTLLTPSDGGVDEQGLHRIAHAHPMGLGIQDDGERHVEIGALVDVDVAEPFVVLEDGHRRTLRDQPHELLPAPRNDEVEVAIQREHRHDGGAVGRVDVLDGVGRQARLLDRLPQDVRDDRVGLERLAASTQQHRVAGLEAESGGIRGDIDIERLRCGRAEATRPRA